MITGLNQKGSSITVQFFQDSLNPWIMIGKVSFYTANLPEPGLVASGLAAVAARWRRRGQDA